MSEPFRLRFVNQIVGVFILAIVLTIVIFALYQFRAKELFAETNTYYLELDHEQLGGMRNGTEVMLLGESAGRVQEISFVPGTNRLRLTLAIKKRFEDQIFEDSFIAMRRRFGVGEPYLEIMRGPRSQVPMPPHVEGQLPRLLTFQSDQDRIEQVQVSISNVERQMVPTLKTIDTTFRSIDKELEEVAAPAMRSIDTAATTVDRSVRNVEPRAVAALEGVEQSTQQFNRSLDRIVGTVDETAANTRETLARIREAAAQVDQSVKSIQVQTNATMEQLERSGADLQRLVNESRQITDALRSEMNDLPGTVERANSTFYNANEVVEALRQHWLLRRYVDPNPSTRQTPPAAIR